MGLLFAISRNLLGCRFLGGQALETILEDAMHNLQIASAASAGGLPALSLYAPVV